MEFDMNNFDPEQFRKTLSRTRATKEQVIKVRRSFREHCCGPYCGISHTNRRPAKARQPESDFCSQQCLDDWAALQEESRKKYHLPAMDLSKVV